MKNGDKQVLSFFNALQNAFRNYGDNIANISSLLDTAIIKLNALIEPTPQNKLKAINLPSIQELNEKINQSIDQLFNQKKKIEEILLTMSKVLEDAKIKCDFCRGEGELRKPGYVREEDMITPIYEYEACPICDGLGYLTISEDIRNLCYEILSSIKRIVKYNINKIEN